MQHSSADLSVFVHLAYGYDAVRWKTRWSSGVLLGFNEQYPYGYHLARDMGCSVDFSTDQPERVFAKAFRLSVRALLGFDLVHAWRNRAGIMGASTVWTHTESQHLAIAFLFKMFRPRKRPRVIGQSVWLIDYWDSLLPPRKLFYRWLLTEIDVLTFLSPLNTRRAKQIFGEGKCQFVPFGICCDQRLEAAARVNGRPVRVLAIGNDRHRDWDCLVDAFAGEARVEVDIVSQTIDKRKFDGLANFHLKSLRRQEELLESYKRADIVVIPLRPNLHASGISCLEEAAVIGRPAVCSRTGGLTDYFTEDEVAFVEPGSPTSLRERVLKIAVDPKTPEMIARAKRRMGEDGLSSASFVRRHVEISRMLHAHAVPTTISAAPKDDKISGASRRGLPQHPHSSPS